MHTRKSLAVFVMTLLLAATAGAAQASDLWIHIKVAETKDNTNVMVNLPISLVEKALALVPEQEFRTEEIQIDGHDFTAEDLRQLWQAVKDTPDANFVTVQSDNETVQVSKSRGMLLVETVERKEKGAQVNVQVPMAVVDALLRDSEDGKLNLAAAFQALAAQGSGEIATISADDANIRVWIDDRPESR